MISKPAITNVCSFPGPPFDATTLGNVLPDELFPNGDVLLEILTSCRLVFVVNGRVCEGGGVQGDQRPDHIQLASPAVPHTDNAGYRSQAHTFAQ